MDQEAGSRKLNWRKKLKFLFHKYYVSLLYSNYKWKIMFDVYKSQNSKTFREISQNRKSKVYRMRNLFILAERESLFNAK